MSLYDNFRAPQYVDFADLLRNDGSTDASSFFDRDLEIDSVVGKQHDNSVMSSEGEKTLTPTAGTRWSGEMQQDYDDMNEDCMNTPDVSIIGVSSRSSAKRTILNQGSAITPKSCKSASRLSRKERDSMIAHVGGTRKTNSCSPFQAKAVHFGITSTPMVRKSENQDKENESMDTTDETVKEKQSGFQIKVQNARDGRKTLTPKVVCKPYQQAVQINVIPPTPNTSSADHSFVTSSMKSPIPVTDANASVKKRSSCIGNGTMSRRSRRSRSADGVVATVAVDDATILEQAMESLMLSGQKARCIPGVDAEEPTSQLLSCVPSVSNSKKRQSNAKDTSRPKRKLSPVPRDYSQQPEKYISMAEHVARIQKQTPTRFRTLPKSDALKKAVQSKVAKDASSVIKAPKLRVVTSDTVNNVPKQQDLRRGVKGDDKGVRVARWPVPRVEPFTLTEYKRKECTPKTMFVFDQRREVMVRDRKTPIKKTKGPTKPEPFSFDKRDQELLQRKRERMNGCSDPELHCCRRNRRRSKSQGAESCKETGEKVIHARVPTVLYKPPFIPHKTQHKVTKPIGFELNTEKRAKEREDFESKLRKREEERQALLQERNEKRKQEEEKEIHKLRKELVHKAHPVPAYSMFQVHPSNAPLTNPHTPPFLHRHLLTASQKREISSDDPMED